MRAGIGSRLECALGSFHRMGERFVQLVLGQVHLGRHQVPHDGLLRLDRLVGVNHQKIEFRAHGQILLQNPPLENPKTLVRIGGQMQIHARLEVLQLRPSVQDALQRHLERGLEKKHQVRHRRKIIDAPHPFRRAAPHRVPAEGGEDIAVAQDQVTGAQQRDQLPFIAVGEIGGMDQAERVGRKQLPLLSLARGILDQLGGIPLAEKHLQPLQFQPALEQVNLGGLARPIQPLHGD